MNNNDHNYAKSDPSDERITKSAKKRGINFIKHI